MSNYFYLVDMQNDRYFYLGKSGTAKYYLPFLAYLFQGKPIIIFGDETNEALYDKYCESEELSLEEFDIEKNDVLPQCNHNLLSTLTMSKVEFDEIFEKIDGKEIINLEDYIRYRYRPNVSTKKNNIERSNRMSTIREQKQTATNTQEFVDYLIHLIETHDDRFSFVLAAGGETNTMKIYDKAKNIDYAVKIEPVKYNDDEDAVNPSDANHT